MCRYSPFSSFAYPLLIQGEPLICDAGKDGWLNCDLPTQSHANTALFVYFLKASKRNNDRAHIHLFEKLIVYRSIIEVVQTLCNLHSTPNFDHGVLTLWGSSGVPEKKPWNFRQTLLRKTSSSATEDL